MTKSNASENSSSAVAVVEPAKSLSAQASASLIAFGGQTFQKAKAVTLPVLKQRSGEEVFFKIDAPIAYEEKTEEQAEKDGGSKDPVPVLTVTCLKTGEQFKYVGNAIFVRELERQYPEQAYVGRYFGVKKLEAREGKRYKDLQVIELIPSNGDEPARAEAKVDSTKR